MPVLVAAGDILLARVVTYTESQLGINVLHYRVSATTGTSCSLDDIALAFDSNWNALYKAVLSQNSHYRGVGVKRVNPNPSVESTSVTNDGVGTVLADPGPKQAAGIITKLTGVAGRANRGRMYVPFPTVDDADVDGSPTNGYQTLLASIASNVLTPDTVVAVGGSATLIPCLAREVAGVWSSKDITGSRVQSKFGTQRRRGDYGKLNALPF